MSNDKEVFKISGNQYDQYNLRRTTCFDSLSLHTAWTLLDKYVRHLIWAVIILSREASCFEAMSDNRVFRQKEKRSGTGIPGAKK